MTVDNETYFALVEEQLAASGQVKIPLVGTSMQPTLCEGDVLTLSSLTQEPQVGDVMLFRYQGKHLLHRLVAIHGDRYIMQGDNSSFHEEIQRADIVATLVDVKKKTLHHLVVRWLGHKGRKQLRPWYFAALAILMWAPLNGMSIPLDEYVLGLRFDHLLHASVFIPCVLFLWDLYKRNGQKWAVWATAVGVGVLSETVQYLLPYRGFDINDMVANFLGVSFGFIVILFLREVRRRHRYPVRAKREGCR